jgi:hypothetical protein
MEPLTLAEWRRNAEARQRIVQAAHRQRNEEIGRLFARLYQLLKPAADRRRADNLAARRRGEAAGLEYAIPPRSAHVQGPPSQR